MNFLGFLYITLEEEESFNMNDACLLHSVNKMIPTILKERGILLNEERGFWKWNYDYKPNPKMIDSILKELSTINNLQNKKRRKMKTKQQEVTEEKVDDKFIKEYGFLNELYSILSEGKSTTLTSLHKKHGTSTTLSLALQNLGIIHNYSSSLKSPDWGWISLAKPSPSLIKKVIEERRNIERVTSNKRKAKKSPKRIIKSERVLEVKSTNRGGKREGAGRKPKAIELSSQKQAETKKISVLWGLFNYEITK